LAHKIRAARDDPDAVLRNLDHRIADITVVLPPVYKEAPCG
jgi:hypothetical protein